MSHVESWKNELKRIHEFRGYISDRDISFQPNEVVARVKSELIGAIVQQVMDEIGPKIDEALRESFRGN